MKKKINLTVSNFWIYDYYDKIQDITFRKL